MVRDRMSFLGIGGVLTALLVASIQTARADILLDFDDVAPGTLLVLSPYEAQGFEVFSTGAGFAFNSVDTGSGTPQIPGINPFFAGANGFTSFAPAIIQLTRLSGEPFSLVSIDLARNFAFDAAPTATFIGALAGGGTVTETFTVTSPSPPLVFQTFTFTGFTGVTSVTWTQPSPPEALHQFGNIRLAIQAVPEPPGLALLALALLLVALRGRSASSA